MLTEEDVAGIGEILESGEDSEISDEPDEVEQASAEATDAGYGDEGEVPSHEESVPYEKFRQTNARVRELEAQLATRSSPDEVQAPVGDYASLDQRIAAIEGERQTAAFNRDLDAVKKSHPVFADEMAEELLLDAIIANPKRPLKEVASRVNKQLAKLGYKPPAPDAEQPTRASSGGAAAGQRSKSVSSIAEATKGAAASLKW